jgi:hypothetical protein
MELRMTARQMERQSQKIEQQEKNERKKILDVSDLNTYFRLVIWSLKSLVAN